MRLGMCSWLKSLRSLRTSIRFQVTFGIWLTLAASIAAERTVVMVYAAPRLRSLVHDQLIQESRFYDAWVQSWEESMKATLHAAALAPALRFGRLSDFRGYLQALQMPYPFYYWRLFNSNGELLASTGPNPDRFLLGQRRTGETDFFNQSMAGRYQFRIIYSEILRDHCLILANPWYLANRPNTPAGVLSFCVPLNKVGSAADLTFLSTRMNIHDVFIPGRGDRTGRAFLLIDDVGSLLFPAATSLRTNILHTPQEVLHSPWRSVVQRARRVPEGQDLFFESVVGGVPVFVYVSNPRGTQWTTINLIDQASALKTLRANLHTVLLIQIGMLILATIVVFLFSSRLVGPVRLAAQGLRQLRSGQFNVNLPVARQDEFGQLLNDINCTAAELGRLVASQTQLALQNQQLETAYSIQQNFLLRSLPQGPLWQLHACTTPALQIGADWYDAYVHGNHLFILVADVCDKGVGSALFMSVFRSLVRYGWQHFCAHSDLSSEQIIVNSIAVANQYMCDNHSEASMFATVFSAVYDIDTGLLTYVNAGHESPFVLSDAGLMELPVTGPAVGIFESARFEAASIPLLPGMFLFAYSDGLPDSRSNTDQSFGKARINSLLQSLDISALTAQGLIEQVQAAVSAHSEGASPFDDLTLLCLHLKPLPKAPPA